MASTSIPRVHDNDRDEITAVYEGKEIRGWSYSNETERRVKITAAREFCEGWYQATQPASPIRKQVVEDALSEICDQLTSEWELTPDEIKALAADIPGECEALRQSRDEQAFEHQQASLMETGGVDDSGYRRQMIEAGRGHLLR